MNGRFRGASDGKTRESSAQGTTHEGRRNPSWDEAWGGVVLRELRPGHRSRAPNRDYSSSACIAKLKKMGFVGK